jgi:hypothetical protein
MFNILKNPVFLGNMGPSLRGVSSPNILCVLFSHYSIRNWRQIKANIVQRAEFASLIPNYNSSAEAFDK